MAKLIYAADDELNIREVLKVFLIDAGYEVVTFENGDSLYERFREKACDLVILDIIMPGSDGLAICNELRKISKVPIILLTAKDAETDYIMGMSVGSDDYIVKPFRPTMLLMKIKAILRRVEMERDMVSSHTEISFGDIRISSYERIAFCREEDLKLTGTEFDLLLYLIKNKQKAISRDEMLENVWGIGSEIETRAVDETIRRIRKKMQNVASTVRIETVWGYGYKINNG
ncbi:MAG: response regulator transcription factor [Lachnospiraceae bacterium]|nr:response regulator transcription factor [Lachnospiraceae bacterium]